MAPPDGDGGASGPATSDPPAQPQGDNSRSRARGRGRGGQKGRGGARRGRGGNNSAPVVPANPARDVAAAAARAQNAAAGSVAKPTDAADDDDEEVCFICANPIAHYSIAPCNHTTCHICGLRMRALYKTKDCAHCRVRRFHFPPSTCFVLRVSH